MEGCLIPSDIFPARRGSVLYAALFVLLCTPATAVHAAAEIAEIIHAMQPGTWHELPDTRMSTAFPPKAGHPAWGVEGPSAIVKAWGGAAFDTQRNVFIITGGGHAAYGGNEVYEFSLADLRWRRMTDPSHYVQDPGIAGAKPSTGYFRTLDGSPISSHTYDGLVYLPRLDNMFMFGGSQYRLGTNYDRHAYLLDLSRSRWTRGARAPHSVIEVASAYDSRRERVLVAYKMGLMAYDPKTDTWAVLKSGEKSEYGRVAAYDPVHDRFVEIGGKGAPVVYYDLANPSAGRKVASLTGESAFSKWRVGFTYDSRQKVFVIWGGGRKVWALDPATWAVTGFANTAGDAPTPRDANGKPKNHGTYSRWQYVPDYDVFIGYNSARDNVWLYRLPAVPHEAASAASAAPAPTDLRTRGANPADQAVPTANMPSLPQPGRVVVTPGATQTSFPRPGQLIMSPGGEAETETETTASVATMLERENCGADLCVGPDYRLKLPSQAAKAAQEGDTVYIEAGDYTDCATWPVSVSIRGIGGRPTIGGKVCDGKGVWITRGAKITIENVELHGALGGTSNAAAIRHEGKALILRNIKIYDSHNGILSGHDPKMSVEIYDSVFHHMHTRGDMAHNIYVGKIARLVAEGNYFYDGQSGHFIKTLAAKSTIAYNRIIDKKGIDAALIDIWGCSRFEVVGNAMTRAGRYGALAFIQITPRRENGEWISCPADRGPSMQGGLVAYNTAFFNNDLHDDPRWANLLHYNYPTRNVLVADNLVVHTLKVIADSKKFAKHGGRAVGNYYTRSWQPSLFVDAARGDLRLRQPLRKAAVPINFVPEREAALPVGTRPRANGRNVGAFAYQDGGGS